MSFAFVGDVFAMLTLRIQKGLDKTALKSPGVGTMAVAAMWAALAFG
jgi:hypothetical protein